MLEMYNYSGMEKVPDAVLEKMLITLIDAGIVDPDNLRNFRIIREYNEMVRDNKMLCKVARDLLAEKYFVSEKTIQWIIYDEKKRKTTMYDLGLKRNEHKG